MPDDELFRQAREGTLAGQPPPAGRPDAGRPQVGRSSSRTSPASGCSSASSAGSRRTRTSSPASTTRLRRAMRQETEQYFAYILRNNRSVLELLDSDYTFVNEPLARHYGIEGVDGRRVPAGVAGGSPARRRADAGERAHADLEPEPDLAGEARPVDLAADPRDAAPAAPARRPQARREPQAADAASLRERMELHRAKPECASCHQQMDPLGFALENYDAVGRWRTKDGGFPIDPSGELIGGRKFADVRELKRLLATTAAKKFARCLVENMLTYALGRGLEAYDYCTVEEIRKQLVANDYRIQQHHLRDRGKPGVPVSGRRLDDRSILDRRPNRSSQEGRNDDARDPPNPAPRHGSRPGAPLAGEPAGRRPARPAKSAKPPVRMCFWYVPNGVHLPAWFPKHEGTLVDLPETLRPLSFARDYLNCFHGLTHNTALTNGDNEGCGHGQGSASFLTGAQALQDAGRRPRRHLGRPALCAARRRRDPLPQPRAGLRVGPLGQRVRLQRDLQDAHLLAHADLARPLRDESQGRLRSPVHQGEQQPDAGHGRRSRLLPQEHDRLRAGRRQPHPRPRRQDRSAQARPVPDRRPRGRAAHPARHGLGGAARARISPGPRASPRSSTSTCG